MNTFIYVSYSREDMFLWMALKTTLALNRIDDRIQIWDSNTDISAGQSIQDEIDTNLKKAQILLLLLSPDFFADKNCLQQMKQAFALKQNQITIVPILLRPCLWQEENLEDMQILPRDQVPVTKWQDRDEALVEVAREVRSIIKGGASHKAGSSTAALTSIQPQQAKTYTIHANNMHVGVIGDNYGLVKSNHKDKVND